jgi:hypothetical protein
MLQDPSSIPVAHDKVMARRVLKPVVLKLLDTGVRLEDRRPIVRKGVVVSLGVYADQRTREAANDRSRPSITTTSSSHTGHSGVTPRSPLLGANSTMHARNDYAVNGWVLQSPGCASIIIEQERTFCKSSDAIVQRTASSMLSKSSLVNDSSLNARPCTQWGPGFGKRKESSFR